MTPYARCCRQESPSCAFLGHSDGGHRGQSDVYPLAGMLAMVRLSHDVTQCVSVFNPIAHIPKLIP